VGSLRGGAAGEGEGPGEGAASERSSCSVWEGEGAEDPPTMAHVLSEPYPGDGDSEEGHMDTDTAVGGDGAAEKAGAPGAARVAARQ